MLEGILSVEHPRDSQSHVEYLFGVSILPDCLSSDGIPESDVEFATGYLPESGRFVLPFDV